MIQEISKLLNDQLDGFHRKIEKNRKDARLQAQYWELIAGHEEIISKLKGMMLNEQYNNPKIKGKYPRSEKLTQILNAICNTIQANGGTASHSEIINALQISDSKMYYYLPMLIDDKRIIKIRPGTYAINSQKKGLTNE